MGYTTEFEGHVTVDPPLNGHEVSFLRDFNESRRMIRRNGPLYVAGSGFMGQGNDSDVIDFNSPNGTDLSKWSFRSLPEDWRDYYEPDGQPGLWCHWTPSDDGTVIEWDGGEKFYCSTEWMKYIISKLLAPSASDYVIKYSDNDVRLAYFTFDHVVNGVIEAQGEDPDDRWRLVVEDNVVTVQQAKISWE